MFKYPFEELFPDLFSLSQDLTGSVVSYWLNGCWIIKVPESGLGDLIAKRKELMQFLVQVAARNFQMDIGVRDRLSWVWDSKKIFFGLECVLLVE